ncbi:unnamed protein product [Coffea canephora]|uniref:DH200=94 genomic scaffold, scaffold_6615 n=1 Tax=Coffea canephora TaxID=49390 RepID=A0A068VM50_COFCA|nr:unnamed protein product [Coffea canephora]
MKVTVVTRSGRELVKGGLDLDDSATVADLQEAIHKRSKSVENASHIALLSWVSLFSRFII